MRRLVFAVALLMLVPAAGTAAPSVDRTRTVLSTESAITQFAQDGQWVAFATKQKKCGPHVHLFSLRTHRIVDVRPSGHSVTCDVYGSLAVAGDRALWTNLVGAGNTEFDVAVETATATAPKPRRIREMSMIRTDFGPDPPPPVVAARGALLTYYRDEDGILAPPTHVVERFAGPRPKSLFQIADPVALAVDAGRVVSAQRQLVRGDACNCNFAPAWSPDGTKIAFISGQVCCIDDQERADIYFVNADGSGRTRVTSDARPKIGVAWSPDGSRLAYGYVNSHLVPTIAIINRDGSDEHDVVAGENPSFSPDGTRLVFDSGGQIETANVNGSNVRTLAKGTNPAWSPDGSRIAFESGINGVRTMSPDGTSQVPVAPLTKAPAWSADGSALAGVATSKPTGLFVAPPFVFVPGTQPSDADPSWSRDGTRLVFDSLRNDLVRGAEQHPDLYVTDVDGTNLHPLIYTRPDEWASVVQVHGASGRLISTRTAPGAPLGVAITGRYAAVLTKAAHTGAKQFEISDARTGRLLRTVSLGWSGAAGPLYGQGARVAYRSGRAIMLLDLRSGKRRRIAVPRGGVVGFALWGNRFFWAETSAHGGRIRSFVIPR